MITFGNPRDFAIQILPRQGGPSEPDPSAAATWVSLEIQVAGKNLTAHTHEDLSTFHTGIHWPAIYLARWFVRAWAGLFESSRWPIPTLKTNARDVAALLDERCLEADLDDDAVIDLRDRFVSRHALMAAAAGAVLPGVYLARDGARVSVAWESPPVGEVVFHHQYGDADIHADSFLSVVKAFVDWTTDELSDTASAQDREELTAWLIRLDSPEQARAILRGYTGLDDERWHAIRPDPETTIESFFGLAPSWATGGAAAKPTSSAIAVAFRCCSPSLTPADLLAIRDLVQDTPVHPDAMGKLDELKKQIPDLVGRMRDYEQGYELAVRVRQLLQNDDDYFDIEHLLDELHIPVQDIEIHDPELDGGSICDAQHGPRIFVNRASRKAQAAWGRRMVLAHELCHLLFDRQRAVPLAIFSGPWAPSVIERRANAFAAELLLPLAGIRRYLDVLSSDATDAQLTSLMNHYKVGLTMCTWHLSNRVGSFAE